MLFNTNEKNMLMGAFTAGGVDAILEGYWAYRYAGGVNITTTPTDPAYWLYASLNYWVPPVNDLISKIGVPALLYYMGKRRRSSKLKAMGIGAGVYGLANIIGWTAVKLSAVAAGMSYRAVTQGVV